MKTYMQGRKTEGRVNLVEYSGHKEIANNDCRIKSRARTRKEREKNIIEIT